MKHLDLTLPEAAANLALDEALLDACEADAGAEVLRFWQPANYFVVVGYANQVQVEVNVEACLQRRIPVLRRCSGGGTVLQGPGCLNYSLVVRIDSSEALQSITGTNRYIMGRNAAALASVLGRPVQALGFTDLALCEVKFSGNAQRRKRQALLFHGTFLLDFDLALVQEVLRPPSKEPEYRQGRSHEKFLTNLRVDAALVKAALRQAWGAQGPLDSLPDTAVLVQERYGRDDWNLKF